MERKPPSSIDDFVSVLQAEEILDSVSFARRDRGGAGSGTAGAAHV